MRRPRKAPCSCSTDPLVTSAAYIFFITDQEGIFHGSPVRGSSLSLRNKLPALSRARHRGGDTLRVPFRCCVPLWMWVIKQGTWKCLSSVCV